MWQVWRFRENLREIVSLKLQYRKGKAIYDNYGIFGGGKKPREIFTASKKRIQEQNKQYKTLHKRKFFLPSIFLQGSIISYDILFLIPTHPLIKIQILTTPTIVWKACDLRR